MKNAQRSMKILYFVPVLALLGLSLSVYADSEQGTLQTWVDYVEEYRQYMERYKQWASDRFEHYQNQISQLVDQLDEKNERILELEKTIDAKNELIQELEATVGESSKQIREPQVELDGESEQTTHRTKNINDGVFIEIQTDRESYNMGDTVTVTGQTNSVFPISIVVFDRNGNIVTIETGYANSDGTFESVYLSGGPLWTKGNYEVRAATSGFETKAYFQLGSPSDYLTTDKETYTAEDTILITGQIDPSQIPERRNLKGETIPPHEHKLGVWISDVSGITCTIKTDHGHNSCSSGFGRDSILGGLSPPSLDKFNDDDNTFSFKARVGENAKAGVYTVTMKYIVDGISVHDAQSRFTVIPLN